MELTTTCIKCVLPDVWIKDTTLWLSNLIIKINDAQISGWRLLSFKQILKKKKGGDKFSSLNILDHMMDFAIQFYIDWLFWSSYFLPLKKKGGGREGAVAKLLSKALHWKIRLQTWFLICPQTLHLPNCHTTLLTRKGRYPLAAQHNDCRCWGTWEWAAAVGQAQMLSLVTVSCGHCWAENHQAKWTHNVTW